MTKLSVRWTIVTLSLIMYSFQLPLKAIVVNGDNIPSYMIAILGWTSIVLSIGNFSWIANIIYFLSLLNFLKNNIRKAITQCIIAFLLSFSVIIFDNIAINESGYLSKITKFEIGYWIWILCFLSTFFAMVIYKLKVKRELQLQ